MRAGGSARHRKLGTKRANKEGSSTDLTNTELGQKLAAPGQDEGKRCDQSDPVQ